jgi:DEAD/DEAH box helicase domain-containing protein
VHQGAVYLHQGEPWVVVSLDLDEAVAWVTPTTGEVSTQARESVDIRVLGVREERGWGPVRLHLGSVEVTSQVVSFQRKHVPSGAVLGEEPLDLPPRALRTTAVWWTMPADLLHAAGVVAAAVPGAAHAAEHAAIGLLPLVAACDRWDVGGVSTALHPDTGLPTIFVHDGHPGGAGFAERGYQRAVQWLTATGEAIGRCPCPTGCPACVQSPKCGNGNEPLDKAAALRLARALLEEQSSPG